jgi:hypothetical protein
VISMPLLWSLRSDASVQSTQNSEEAPHDFAIFFQGNAPGNMGYG